jgi:YfiH family protein
MGDFAGGAVLPPHVPGPVTWLRQVHGADVVTVTGPGEHSGVEADAAVSAAPGCAVAVRTADCAPIVVRAAEDAAVAVIHAGWRGLVAGVVEAAVEALRAVGGSPGRAVIGPCIQPGCYEFGADDLDAVAAVFGDDVRAETMWGTPALDLPGAAAIALERAGVAAVARAGICTACSRDYFSHRARSDCERMATFAWLEP